MAELNEHMPTPNQLHVTRDDITITEQDLVEIPKGTVTEDGININVGILYTEAWLRGHGAVALYNLMKMLLHEISRTQVWQWLHKEVVIEGGRTFNMTLYKDILMMK
jgi:malate synthase